MADVVATEESMLTEEPELTEEMDAQDGEAFDPEAHDEEMEDESEEEDEEKPRRGHGRLSQSQSQRSQKQVAVQKDGAKQVRPTFDRTGLVFPVHRVSKALKKGGYTRRLGPAGAVYMTAVMEYVAAEMLELAANAAKEQKRMRIMPRHIQLAIRSDDELNRYLKDVTIAGGGVVPSIHNSLLSRNVGAP